MATAVKDPAPGVEARISDGEFETIRKLVYRHFGITLSDQKKTLVVGRLQKVLAKRGMPSFAVYIDWLQNDKSGVALDELANRITTNHTFFFRENAHFDFFSRKALPEIVARHRAQGDQDLRIWCAGCSSGEEPYTLMMLIMELLGKEFSSWNITLLATDLSARILKKAMTGSYAADRVQALPKNLRSNYFNPTSEGTYLVTDAVRQRIFFRRHNLMDSVFPFKKQFDAIFCRNVMIYFDQETRQNLVAKYHKHTVSGGYLFVGHAESLNRNQTEYKYVMPAVYQK